ncbi:uncharacterized protein C11orf98 homolog isoform X1 [Lethenteron reissneri]|uniref:uncharacterized protein C11orf98 homolog isoform X1 n=1 Tax=Lethenteron reissneri TaxID=7753 RepID=UPI002AB5DE0D|nr:uncharacterized protein C11orf98 homolog isoform X1 [Lethenteron reissneri]
MGPGGHINRPRMEVRKSVVRLRRTLKRDRLFNKKARAAAVALTQPARYGGVRSDAAAPLPRWTATRPPKETPVSGKRRRKQLKRLRHIQREQNTMQVETEPQPSLLGEQLSEKSATSSRRKRKQKQQQPADVEMTENTAVVV